eukprot:TCALIF_06847-PA protein Name:"Similar to PLD1 Phospholipase D alpha 1 (Oryza sativa subsp. japonica)" AED:0.00 eAED:0.00 QI:0/0.87/0.66/0.88/1/1/9/545/745
MKVIYNNLFPQWNELFRVSVCHHAKKIIFRVKDQDELGSENLGEVVISIKEQLLTPTKRVQGWQKIVDDNGSVQGELNINLVYLPYLEDNSSCNDMACSQCYFPLRPGNQVTLYSCARNVDDTIEIPTGTPSGPRVLHYTPPSLWIDLFKSLIQSKRFIYVMGWSIYTRIHLLRNDDHKHLNTPDELKMANATLGELLKQKAEEGVRVLLMIWGETTSIMGTHDSETENYFKGSRVFVARVARQTKTKEYKDLDAHFTANLGYSHHQKAVIVDVPVLARDSSHPNEMVSRIIAFTGGIDITDGRYDTPEHPLFSSLRTTHQKDFYQPCEPTARPNSGPRMPWHDIHVKVEGPAARDIMVNFVERWGKEQSMNTRLLIQNVEAPSFDLSPRGATSGSSCFSAQVFRSITSDSARFQLENETTFTTKKGRSVDNSIARAYIAAIRKAKKFIYIENQYFMGSAYGWLDYQDVHCYNVIPMEITQKICESIQNRRRFVAYVVIPMHPEGMPGDTAIQEMLFWQRNTMHMMYSRIAQALHRYDVKGHPTEYLMFFCLGKRETPDAIPAHVEPPWFWTQAAKLFKSRRFMIYVHSKLMVIDDSYLITGSANINQRSLDGDRDSELAVGLFQPAHVTSTQSEQCPQGEIFKFRMALFREHLHCMDPTFVVPHSEKCVAKVQELALRNWDDYVSLDGQPAGHLLAYPIDVSVTLDEDIPVVNLIAKTKRRTFPDTNAKILGNPARSIPNKLTT